MRQERFSTRPLYLQVRDDLAQRIATGAWKPGHTLPNEIELAQEVGVSSGTMRRSLDLLESEHLVTRRQGRGTFVNDPGSQDLAHRFDNIHLANGTRVEGEVRTLDIASAEASGHECSRLKPRQWRPCLSHHAHSFALEQGFHVRGSLTARRAFPRPCGNSPSFAPAG